MSHDSNTDKLAEALRLSIKTLEDLQGGCTDSDDGTVEALTVWCPEVITELYTALDAYEAEAKPAPAEPVAWGMRDKTTGLILDVICPDEHDSHEGDYTIPLYAAPAAPAGTVPATVWEAANDTSSMIFASEECGRRWLSQFSASVAGGFGLYERNVHGAAPAAPAPVPDRETALGLLTAAAKDAERYRWLRTCTNEIVAAIWNEDSEGGAYYGFTNPEALDAEIDAAIAASKGGADARNVD